MSGDLELAQHRTKVKAYLTYDDNLLVFEQFDHPETGIPELAGRHGDKLHMM
jgi:hypothetical protein